MAERDPTVALWPMASLREIDSIEVEMQRPAVMGPPPLSGAPQMVVSGAGSWRLAYVGVQAHILNLQAFRVLLAKHRGRAAPIYVGPYDYANGPFRRAGAVSPIESMWSDLTIFSDGTRWETSIYDCTLAADAAQGATQISLTNSVMAPLSAGDYFELAGRLHLIEDLSGSAAKIWPPLRASYSSGQKIEIDDPRMLAYLDIAGGQSLRLQYGHWGSLTLNFLEAPW